VLPCSVLDCPQEALLDAMSTAAAGRPLFACAVGCWIKPPSEEIKQAVSIRVCVLADWKMALVGKLHGCGLAIEVCVKQQVSGPQTAK
jgi:hypothetical protein